jgi:hypothetical protein
MATAAAPKLTDKGGEEIRIGCRVAEADFSYGDGVVESITVPITGDGFNVGIKWDTPELGGPPWSAEGGGRSAEHLLVLGPPPELLQPPPEQVQPEKVVAFRQRFGRSPTQSEAELDEEDWVNLEEEEEEEEEQGQEQNILHGLGGSEVSLSADEDEINESGGVLTALIKQLQRDGTPAAAANLRLKNIRLKREPGSRDKQYSNGTVLTTENNSSINRGDAWILTDVASIGAHGKLTHAELVKQLARGKLELLAEDDDVLFDLRASGFFWEGSQPSASLIGRGDILDNTFHFHAVVYQLAGSNGKPSYEQLPSVIECGLAITSLLSGDGWYLGAFVGSDQEGSRNFLNVYSTEGKLHVIPVEHTKQRVNPAGVAFFCDQETVDQGLHLLHALSQLESPGSLFCKSKAAIEAAAAVTAAAAAAAAGGPRN